MNNILGVSIRFGQAGDEPGNSKRSKRFGVARMEIVYVIGTQPATVMIAIMGIGFTQPY